MPLGISPFMRVVLVAVGIVLVIVLVGTLQNMVALPLINNHWSKQGDAYLEGSDAPGARQPIAVVIPSYGHLQDTAAQVSRLLKHAKCAQRVTVVVVAHGQCQDPSLTQAERSQSVLQRLTLSAAFRGVADRFSLAEHVLEVDGGPEPMGAYQALACGMEELARLQQPQLLHTVVLMEPHTSACRHWDELLMADVHATPTPAAAALSFAVTSETMHNASFPVIASDHGFPTTAWKPFHTAPMAPHPARCVSTNFLCLTLPRPAAQARLLADALRRMPCPPVAADLLLSLFLQQRLGLRLFHPTHLLVNGRPSANLSRMHALMRKRGSPQAAANERTTAHVARLLRKHAAAFGVNPQGVGSSYEALMGLLPPRTAGKHELEEDVRVKYGSEAACAAAWKRVRRQCRTWDDDHGAAAAAAAATAASQ